MTDTDLAASIAIGNKNNVWINDNMVKKCYNCNSEFSYFKKKHHCRNCGNIFCYKCSNYYIKIPNFITDRPEPKDVWNASYYLTFLKNDEERVCKNCYNLIRNKIATSKKIAEMLENPLCIDEVRVLPELDNDIREHYYDQFRNIQYYLPNHEYTNTDIKLLNVNSKNLSGHSKYIVHLIKATVQHNSIDISSKSEENYNTLMEILLAEPTHSCGELFCTRTCQKTLSSDDCINILYSCSSHLPNNLLDHIFDILISTHESIIIAHILFFINIIKTNNRNKYLQKKLYQLLSKNIKLVYLTIWYLKNSLENCYSHETLNIGGFIKLFHHDIVAKIDKEYIFFEGIINNMKNIDKLKLYINNNFYNNLPITLPYDPDYKIIDIDLDNIETKDSYTRPIIIKFKIEHYEDNDSTDPIDIKILFKNENIHNDIIVLNTMSLMNIILNRDIDENFSTIVYPAMSLTHNSGIIEIVENSETVYAINKKRMSILQYILEENQEQKIKNVLDRYMYSLVTYTLNSYFIGLGDRHLQNIMVSNTGEIFHIDFGFILGNDIYQMSNSNIKLNSDMLNVIIGKRSETYIELCSQGIILLRKYFSMFFIMFSQNSNIKSEIIEKFIMSRFQPRQSDPKIVDELLNIIEKSNNSYSGYIRDFLKYHTCERTVQNGVTNTLYNALELLNNLKNSVK